MKKLLKSSMLFLLIGALLFGLVACGEEGGNTKETVEKIDKLVATKQVEDEEMGNYTEKVEVTYKDNKATQVKMAMVFEKEEMAEAMYSLYNLGMSMAENTEEQEQMPEGIEVKQEGKEFIIIMDAKNYIEENDVPEEETTKEAMQKSLEEDGYTIQ